MSAAIDFFGKYGMALVVIAFLHLFISAMSKARENATKRNTKQ